jgi:hypothetical protein
MRNILSYAPDTAFSGQEILDWANYQVENKTGHFRNARLILHYYKNLRAETLYTVRTYRTPNHWYERVQIPLIAKKN